MEIELLPAVSLLPETLSVLVAPEEMLARALNGNPHLQQFRILFIAGIRSGILSRLDRSAIELIVRRAFTSLQLRTILEKNQRPFLIVERRASERVRDMAGRVAEAMKQASPGCILQYAPVLDRHLEAKARARCTLVFCFYDMPEQAYSQGRNITEEMASQTTWEASHDQSISCHENALIKRIGGFNQHPRICSSLLHILL